MIKVLKYLKVSSCFDVNLSNISHHFAILNPISIWLGLSVNAVPICA